MLSLKQHSDHLYLNTYFDLLKSSLIFATAMYKNLIPLNLPQPQLKLGKKADDIMVWDDIRKKYLKLTPEEWVRQHFVHFLIDEKGYPKSSIALEGGFQLYEKLQRTDILIYKDANPILIVECKAPQVPVSQKTFDQAARYNLHYKTPYIAITNGLEHYAVVVDSEKQTYQFLKSIPHFNEL